MSVFYSENFAGFFLSTCVSMTQMFSKQVVFAGLLLANAGVVFAAKHLSASAKPLTVSSKPVRVPAKPLAVSAKPVTVPARPLAGVGKPSVSDCFKVHALVKMDDIHYWADWTNACPYTIDSVYVMVSFNSRAKEQFSDGVWPMYFVTPGTHRVTRFTIPAKALGFESLKVRKITTDSTEALALR